MVEDFDVSKVAKLLAKDEVIARCVGKAEFGARALGNRSIIGDPRNKSIQSITTDIKKLYKLNIQEA